MIKSLHLLGCEIEGIAGVIERWNFPENRMIQEQIQKLYDIAGLLSLVDMNQPKKGAD